MGMIEQEHAPKLSNLAEHDNDIAHGLIHEVGDNFGYWWIIILVLVGAYWLFRKKFKDFLGNLFK